MEQKNQTQQNNQGKPKKVAFLIIGDEILCGKTQDTNLKTLALKLGEKGYLVGEVRVVADDFLEIAEAINALKNKYFLVFTSGGIGPTHDDITSEAIAKALNLEFEINEEARQILTEYYNSINIPFNEARLRMAMMPKGATLIANPVSKAPAFKIENICVLAGVPSIFTAMLEEFLKTLPDGMKMHSISIQTTKVTEGAIATELGLLQKKYAGVVFIGSYPKLGEGGGLSLQLTFRSTNLEKALECKALAESIIEKV